MNSYLTWSLAWLDGVPSARRTILPQRSCTRPFGFRTLCYPWDEPILFLQASLHLRFIVPLVKSAFHNIDPTIDHLYHALKSSTPPPQKCFKRARLPTFILAMFLSHPPTLLKCLDSCPKLLKTGSMGVPARLQSRYVNMCTWTGMRAFFVSLH